jgi:hypothetical protein
MVAAVVVAVLLQAAQAAQVVLVQSVLSGPEQLVHSHQLALAHLNF